MPTVGNLLEKKGSLVWTITADAPIREALALMAAQHIGALPVMDGERVVGIFSERDYARQVAKAGALSLEKPVRDIMVHPVYFVRPEQDVEECMNVMTARRFRHLPVMEEDRLVGIVSIGDVVKNLIEERQLVIENLHYYIAGRAEPR